MTWLAANIAPVMFLSLVLFLLTGFPSPSVSPPAAWCSGSSASNSGWCPRP